MSTPRAALRWALGAVAALFVLSLAAAPAQPQSEPDEIARDVELLMRSSELETVRTSLASITSTYAELGELRGDADALRTFAGASQLVERLTLEDLDELVEIAPRLERLAEATDGLYALALDDMARAPDHVETASPGLPDAQYSSDCGSARPSTGTVFAALLAFTIADSAREGASRGCDQVAVAAGFGGNAALACLVLDVVRQGAKGFYDGLIFCVDDIDSAEIEGTYERVGHLHGDIESIQAAVDGIEEVQETVDSIEMKVDILDERVVILDGRVVVLDERVVVLDGKVDMLAAAVEELRQTNCDIIRLLHTPEGNRSSAIPTCADQRRFPYDWPEPPGR